MSAKVETAGGGKRESVGKEREEGEEEKEGMEPDLNMNNESGKVRVCVCLGNGN